MVTLPKNWLDRRLDYQLPMLRGTDVRVVQLRLRALGFVPADAADGLFGPTTRNAVRAFQEQQGLVADGVVDEATMTRLMLGPMAGAAEAPTPFVPQALTAPVPATPPPAPPPPILTQVLDRVHAAAHPPAVLRADWLPPAKAERIVCHWTGGNHRASSEDREHYHFLVQGDGEVVRGRHPVNANDDARDGVYAAHTRGKNTRSIGVAVCCMFDAKERPFVAGRFPMTEVQWRRMAEVVAQLCQRYRIAVTPETVLAHGEVEPILGVKQRAKWDPLVLPWASDLERREVGERFRRQVLASIGAAEQPERLRRLRATVAGQRVRDAASFDCALWLEVGALVDDLGWRLIEHDTTSLTLVAPGDRTLYLDFAYAPDDTTEHGTPIARDALLAQGFVRARDLAEQLGLGLDIAEDGSHLDLTGQLAPTIVREGVHYRAVTIGRGDTLAAIAARVAGEPGRWRQILAPDGQPFDEARARSLEVGWRVLVPVDAPAGSPAVASALARSDGLEGLAVALAELAPPWLRSHARQAVPVLVGACLAHDVIQPAHIAYVLATAEHETNFGRLMEEKWVNSPEQRRYEGRFGNAAPGDGKRYRGRGYVQITFRANYEKFRSVLDGVDLVTVPERAAEPDLAARIAVVGMRDGMFTRHKLADHLNELDGDFVTARRIINDDIDRTDAWDETGTPRGQRIAARARAFTAVLAQHLAS